MSKLVIKTATEDDFLHGVNNSQRSQMQENHCQKNIPLPLKTLWRWSGY